MQSKEETYSVWALFLHDCFQSRLANLPVLLERQSMKTALPRRAEVESAAAAQQSLQEVEAYMKRRRGLPMLETSDNSMSLLVKVGLVLDQCCECAMTTRQIAQSTNRLTDRSVSLQEERDKAFAAAHESIRNSRMMLSHFDDQTVSQTDFAAGASTGGTNRESLTSTLILHDELRFAAEVTHHLAVLSLFETDMNAADPFVQAEETRDMMCNAAVWLSRLAGMALHDTALLYAAPSFCSMAYLIAARWLLFLQGADPDNFHADISTLVLALSTRAKSYSRDCKSKSVSPSRPPREKILTKAFLCHSLDQFCTIQTPSPRPS